MNTDSDPYSAQLHDTNSSKTDRRMQARGARFRTKDFAENHWYESAFFAELNLFFKIKLWFSKICADIYFSVFELRGKHVICFWGRFNLLSLFPLLFFTFVSAIATNKAATICCITKVTLVTLNCFLLLWRTFIHFFLLQDVSEVSIDRSRALQLACVFIFSEIIANLLSLRKSSSLLKHEQDCLTRHYAAQQQTFFLKVVETQK